MIVYIYNNKTYFDKDFIRHYYPNISFPNNISDLTLRKLGVIIANHDDSQLISERLPTLKINKMHELSDIREKLMKKRYDIDIAKTTLFFFLSEYNTIHDAYDSMEDSTVITDSTNRSISLTKDEVLSLLTTLTDIRVNIDKVFEEYKNKIVSCTTVDELSKINIEWGE